MSHFEVIWYLTRLEDFDKILQFDQILSSRPYFAILTRFWIFDEALITIYNFDQIRQVFPNSTILTKLQALCHFSLRVIADSYISEFFFTQFTWEVWFLATFANGIRGVGSKVVLTVLSALEYAVIIFFFPSTRAFSSMGAAVDGTGLVRCVHIGDKDCAVSANQVVVQTRPCVFIPTITRFSSWMC